jgi:hypothetical protein
MSGEQAPIEKPRLLTILRRLEDAGIRTWVAGGWAQELQKLIEPRAHKDIDLFHPAEDFAEVDAFLASAPDLEEIGELHFPHKRGFNFQGVTVEVLLLQPRGDAYITDYWNRLCVTWPRDTLSEHDGLRVVSAQAVEHHWAWKDRIHAAHPWHDNPRGARGLARTLYRSVRARLVPE